MGKVVGIDLGTTNSLVAYATERGPVVIRDASGDALVPSVVSVEASGTVFVGREAQRRLLTDPSRTVYSVKRFMGRGVDDVQGEAHLLPFRVGGEPGGVVRIGVGEREFDMLKFRSMYRDAAEHQAELEPLNEASGAIFKIREDPRVTPVGRVLRRLSLDELPQLVNVLRREMSLVGPRPLPLRDYELLEPWHRKRYLVLPGMTGLWQVAGRSSLGFDDLVRLDFYYLEHWSIWLDVSILLKTIPAVLGARGAY